LPFLLDWIGTRFSRKVGSERPLSQCIGGRSKVMRSFAFLFPQVAERETLTLTALPGFDLPPGRYGFCEFYCIDRRCDCRIVQLLVHSGSCSKDWAAINYGWESAFFYAQWAGCSLGEARKMCGAGLDRASIHDSYAQVLLHQFTERVADAALRRRFARHYRLFKGKVRELTTQGRLPEGW
jgi:hypothetical protein